MPQRDRRAGHQTCAAGGSLTHTCAQARIEALGQALLRRTQEGATTPLGLVHMRGRRAVVAADAYEEHFLLPDDLVVVLTNRRWAMLRLLQTGGCQV